MNTRSDRVREEHLVVEPPERDWPKLKTKEKKCPTCKGEGLVYLVPRYAPEGLYTCLRCCGRGKL